MGVSRTRLVYIIALVLMVFSALFWSDPSRIFTKWSRYLWDTAAYDAYIQEASCRHGVDGHLVKALIKAESHFDEEAVSSRGAMGLMQLMPATARSLGVENPFDPKENIEGGTRYLKTLLQEFNNNLLMALAAYNAGPTVVKRFGCIPPFPETQAYLRRVMEFYADYRENI